MYFLNEEEKRLLLRRILPQARQKDIAHELRGWNWDKPPLSPIYDGVKLGVADIANNYCPTNRDLYLRRVMGVKMAPNRPMLEGGLLHEMLCRMVIAIKRVIYLHGVNCLKQLEALDRSQFFSVLDRANGILGPEDITLIKTKLEILWDYEYHNIYSRLQNVLSAQPRIGPDAMVALALPVTVEQKLNGSFLGLSAHLSADAFVFSEPMVVDFKFGQKEKFHKLSVTGYALVMESLYEYPINAGCIVYPSFAGDRLTIERDFCFIDDELRQWFIEERDERMRMVHEEIDPGLAKQCPEICSLWQECHPK
ncbi:MAG TPA: type I-A CRISPR-associated protein Cas4/Csa1 [Dehalococcoidales bacterium]|nr:type I-A CRISPR-associated protein Cas4/Csa1 [Dehalococcoidales bacterium]